MWPFAIGMIVILLLAGKKNQGSGLGGGNHRSELYSWLAKKEGRLGTSSLDAAVGGKSPCTIKQGSITIKNPSVSRGVTWGTFKNLAPIIGYDPTCENFGFLSGDPPFSLWYKIVDHFLKKGLLYTKQPLLADYMGLWHWGGWDTNLVPVSAVKEILDSRINDKAKLYQLVMLRKEYFDKVAARNPATISSVPSWKERADDFYSEFSKYV